MIGETVTANEPLGVIGVEFAGWTPVSFDGFR
jgi:hypothetical protein